MNQKEIFDIKIKMTKIQKAFDFMNKQIEDKTSSYYKEIMGKSNKRKKRQSINLLAYWVIFFGLIISKNFLNMPELIYTILFFTNIGVLLGQTIYSIIAVKLDSNKFNKLSSLVPESMMLQMTVVLYMNTLEQRYNDAIANIPEVEQNLYREYENSRAEELEAISSLELNENSVEDLLNSVLSESVELAQDSNDDYQEYLDLTEEYASHIKDIINPTENITLENKKLELK